MEQGGGVRLFNGLNTNVHLLKTFQRKNRLKLFQESGRKTFSGIYEA